MDSRFGKRRQRYLRTVRDPRRTPAGELITADIDRRSISHAEAEAKGAAATLPPLAGYALVGAAFGAAVVGVAAFGRAVERPSALDLALLAGATFKTARIVSRGRLGRVVRARLSRAS